MYIVNLSNLHRTQPQGADIGPVPYDVWFKKAELGFKKAAYVGYLASEKSKPELDPLKDGSVRVVKIIMADWIKRTIEPQIMG